jgi:hypothetical protein
VAAAAQTTNRSKIRETEEPALTYRRPMTEGIQMAVDLSPVAERSKFRK